MTVPFTPGPWQYVFERAAGVATIVEPVDGVTVAHLSTTENTTAHSSLPANVRLMAQAPAMFACLNQFLREHDALCLAKGLTEDRWTCAAWARKILADAGAA